MFRDYREQDEEALVAESMSVDGSVLVTRKGSRYNIRVGQSAAHFNCTAEYVLQMLEHYTRCYRREQQLRGQQGVANA